MNSPGKPLVSILIPCFNAGSFLKASIDSALAQTWPNKEIIIVDDGSSDQSLEVARAFESRDVRVIEQPNRGASAARNRALLASQGDYIKFFDADDVLHPEMVKAQIERLAGSERAVASAEWGRFYREDLADFRLSRESVWCDMSADDWLVCSWTDARPMMQPALFLIPRSILCRSGHWDERLSLIDDFEFFARVLCKADEVRFTAGAPLYYRSGMSQSLSQRATRRAVESAFQSLWLGTTSLLKKRFDACARRACANLWQNFIFTYYPSHADLRAVAARKVNELGGAEILPDGSPKFQQLRRFVGWKLARRAQLLRRR